MTKTRIESYGEDGVYIAFDPDGLWNKSTEVYEGVTADWDVQGRLIGLEIAGSEALNITKEIDRIRAEAMND